MNLFEKIAVKVKWLRTQPDSVKTKYVWVPGLIVFAVVFLLWVGLFKKYERSSPNDGKGSELLIEEGKRFKEEIGNKIKVPEINLPIKETPLISPGVSPEVSPAASPELSPVVSPKVSPVVSPKILK
jgi:hypothetical protein